MTSLISAAPVATGQIQSLDGLRAHALPTDALIVASATQVNPTNQNPGSYAIVESGINSLGVTATGSVPAVTQSPFADVYKEGSIYLNGVTGNYLQNTASYSNSTIQWNTTGMTIECWVNYPTFTGASIPTGASPTNIQSPTLVGLMTPAATTNWWSFGSNINGYVTFYYYGNSNQQSVMAQTPISANTWNHIAVSIAPSGFIYIFINGVQSQVVANRGGTLQAAAYYETPQSVNTINAQQALTIGQYTTSSGTTNAYVADLRITTGVGLYTGSTSSLATFTVPSAPLSTAATGATQFLLRAGQNSPTIQSGALTFDRGLKQYMNFGPQTFNIVTQGFTVIWKGAFTGTASNYERIFEFGTDATNGYMGALRLGTGSSIYFFICPSGSTSAQTVYPSTTIVQGTTYVFTFRYNPVTQILDAWTNGVQVASSTVTPATLGADRILTPVVVGGYNAIGTTSMTSNAFAVYNRALTNTEIFTAYQALTTVPATPLQKTLEIGDVNGTPALSVAGDGKVFMDSVGLTSNVLPWPPAAMTGYDTVINGQVYKARASNEVSQLAWNAFDGSTSTGPFFGAYNTSGFDTSGYTTTDVNGSQFIGGWLQIQLPTAITLSNYTFNFDGSNYTPRAFWILGSRDGVNWTLVHWVPSWNTSGGTTTFTLPTPLTQSYSYFRVVVNKTGGSTGATAYVREWTLYGTADTSPALTIAPATTFSTSVATPALTGIAGDRYVPQDFSSSGLNIPAYVVSNTATTANTVTYSAFGPFAGEGSLYFPGGTGAYVNFGNQLPLWSGATSDMTVECWVYLTQHSSNQEILLGRGVGPSSLTYDWILLLNSAGACYFNVGASVVTGQGYSAGFVLNAWNHVAGVVKNGVVYSFINGSGGTLATISGTVNYHSNYNTMIGSGATNNTTYGYISSMRVVQGQALYTTNFTPPTGPLQPIQGVTQSGTPYGTVLLLRNAPAPVGFVSLLRSACNPS